MTPTHPAVLAAGRIDQVRRLDPLLHRAHLEVRTWCLAQGVAIDRDALTVVLAAAAEAERLEHVDARWWSVERVVEFAWGHCPIWCLEHAVAVPKATPAALRIWWDFLAATGAFAPGSDAVPALRRALAAHTGRPRRGGNSSPRKHTDRR